MIVYHGTTSAHVDAILAGGLAARTCVTPDEDLAWYYAETTAEDEQTAPVVVRLEADPDGLVADVEAIAEPVGWGGRTSRELEDTLSALAEDERYTVATSLAVCASARLLAAADAAAITVV